MAVEARRLIARGAAATLLIVVTACRPAPEPAPEPASEAVETATGTEAPRDAPVTLLEAGDEPHEPLRRDSRHASAAHRRRTGGERVCAESVVRK